MTTGNPFTDDRPPSFFRGLISAAAALLLLCLCALLGALLAGATGCTSAPPGAWDEATNAAVRAAVAIRAAPTNEWWRTFPETEEEYLALCEPKIQEKLLDYPEEERERMYDLLVSEASTAYLFQSIYAALLRDDENRARDETRDPATTPEAPAADPAPAPPSEAPAPALDFRYGGFRGGGAKEDPRCRISSFRMTGGGMSFRWESSPRIPADWKRNDGEKGPMIVAAIFFWDGKKWIGGKFDWIDESRTTRDFKNIYGDYNGWSADAFFGGSRHAFCVVSADGKWRSNLITE